jgi:hypothetical protein
MKDKIQFKKFMERLSTIFCEAECFNDKRADVFWDILKDYTDEECVEAARRLEKKTQRFPHFPYPAEFIKEIESTRGKDQYLQGEFQMTEEERQQYQEKIQPLQKREHVNSEAKKRAVAIQCFRDIKAFGLPIPDCLKELERKQKEVVAYMVS